MRIIKLYEEATDQEKWWWWWERREKQVVRCIVVSHFQCTTNKPSSFLLREDHRTGNWQEKEREKEKERERERREGLVMKKNYEWTRVDSL
jgi:hypothetical protein